MRKLWSGIAVGVGLIGLLGWVSRSLHTREGDKSGRESVSADAKGDVFERQEEAVKASCGQRDWLATSSVQRCGLARVQTGPGSEGERHSSIVALRPDSTGQYIWLSVGGHSILRIAASEREGLKLLVTWLVDSGCLDVMTAAALQGVQPRTVEAYGTSYAATHNSIGLIDWRHFNPGQQTDYRAEEHRAALIHCAVLNTLRGESNTERGLSEQLGGEIDDRTVGRQLHKIGWRAAEAAGLADEVAAYVDKVQREAYWAGVSGQPLERVLASSSRREWQRPQAGVVGGSLGVAHLAMKGTYASLKRLVGDRLQQGHTYLIYLIRSGGGRVSQAKYFVWKQVEGLLVSCKRASATGLRRWLVSAAKQAQEKVRVCRSDGGEESISRLQDYQEEAVAQRALRGLIRGGAIYVDDYVNAIYRREPVAQTKHGTWARVVKAFRRHMVQDADTGHAITCPLGRSDVTPLAVLQQVVRIVQGGLDRAGLGQKLVLIIVDRWWSVKSAIDWVLEEDRLKMLVWGKNTKLIRDALAEVDEEELKKQPVMAKVQDKATGQVEEKVIGHRLDTDLSLDGLEQAVRGVVDWDGQAGSQKRVRLAVGIGQEDMTTQAIVDGLRFRQRVEILLKLWQRRLNLPAFGGGEAKLRPATGHTLDEETHQKLIKNHKQVSTRLANDQARLKEVEQDLERLQKGKHPTNSLKLGRRDLKKVAQNLRRSIQRATARLKELSAWLMAAQQGTPPPPAEPVADLDLTRESIVTQLKLDVLTAQESLVDDFIECLKPVLRQEAEQQAAARQQNNLCSTAKGYEGQPLCTDVEKLYQTKLANLERETILNRLLNQPGEFVRHKTQRIILVVFQRFHDRRTQAAFERYCVVLNQRDIRIPLDDGEPWRLLFTYHLDTPSSHAQFK